MVALICRAVPSPSWPTIWVSWPVAVMLLGAELGEVRRAWEKVKTWDILGHLDAFSGPKSRGLNF